MIVKQGFDGLSMQKLATAAGVSPATIYIYFKDRADLIYQLFIDIHSRMLMATLKNFDVNMHFDEGLRIQWKNRAAFCMKYPLEMAFLEQIRHSPLNEKTIPVQVQAFKNAMHAFVSKAIERKELMPLPIEVYWSIAYAPLYQLVKYHMQGKSFTNNRFRLQPAMMEQALKLVLKALKPEHNAHENTH